MINFSEIKPICLYLPDSDYWIQRRNRAITYFAQNGINDILWVNGIFAEGFGVEATRVYDRDPQNIQTGWKIPPKTVGNFLSWYMAFNIMLSHPEFEYWLVIEDDLELHDNWRERVKQGLKDVPEDFDYFILSHCCTDQKPTTHIKGEVFEVKYPQAGAPAIVHKRCLPFIISKLRNACVPADVCLHDSIFEHLKVYTLLPRIAEQISTFLPK